MIELGRKYDREKKAAHAAGRKYLKWSTFLEREQRVCNHDYQPKFYSANDSFAGLVCDKCGKRG